MGQDYQSWQDVLGHHGIGNENSNGTRLLQLCSDNNLLITNTIFEQDDNFKTTWMHPGLKQWHLIDFVITRQRDKRDVNHTKAMCGTCV